MKKFFICVAIVLYSVINSIAGPINGNTIISTNSNEKKLLIELKNHLIVNADIKNIPLRDVLKEIEKKSDININIFDDPGFEKKITTTLSNVEIEYFLKSVLLGNYVFIFTKVPNQNEYVLAEVGIANKSMKTLSKIITKEITYGSGKYDIGSIRAGEGANIGPGSFATDSKGNIYICDTVNKKIQIISPDGIISCIQLKGQHPEDISIDDNGFSYIYDAEGILYQYDNSGNLISEMPVDESRWDSRGPMHIINNEIYVRGSGIGDILVAKIENGKLNSPTEEEFKKDLEQGIYGSNGQRYVAFLKEEEKVGTIEKGGGLEVIEKNGTKSTRFIPLEGIVSVEFVGESRNGDSYVKTESDRDGELIVEVSRFDAKGNYVNTVTIPGKDYDFWAIKTVSVGVDGTIYQMMPGKDKLTLNSFFSN